MRASGIILGLMLGVHMTAHPIDDDNSGLLQNKAINDIALQTAPEEPTRSIHQARSPAEGAAITITETITAPAPTPTQVTATCQVKYHVFWDAYSILIGMPYQGAALCNDIFDILYQGEEGYVTQWQCVNENGNIRLWFIDRTHDRADINRLLTGFFPNVAGGFQCPPQDN